MEETLKQELLHAAQLDNKHRGELAELAFMRKASTLGFAVAKAWGDSDRYDVVVRVGQVFWRVQVKSVRAKAPQRSHYRVHTVNWLKAPYKADEIDFLVAYIVPEDTWYVFPVLIVENRKSLCITPRSKRSPFEPYREAWKLMGFTGVEPTAVTAPQRSQPPERRPTMGRQKSPFRGTRPIPTRSPRTSRSKPPATNACQDEAPGR